MRKDSLSGDFVIYQPDIGQRYSTDDMLTAWLACREFSEKPVSTFLDLGSGLCSVPMIILWKFKELTGTGIEIRPERRNLGLLSLKENNLLERFNLLEGNLAELNIPKKFDAVTSTPPYYDISEGPLSPHPDKAAARFELKGSIDSYFKTASSHIRENGIFITVYPYQYKERVYKSAKDSGFSVKKEIDIIPREKKPPLISLFSLIKNDFTEKTTETLTVRDLSGNYTDEYNKSRVFVGFIAK